MHVRRRRRGTAIVETPKGILVTSGRSKVFILPGGGANHGESRENAAIRELKEETGLTVISSKYLFRYLGKVHNDYRGGFFQDHHKVFQIKTMGVPHPRKEVKYITWYKPCCSIRISGITKEIIEKYCGLKK